DLNAEPCDLRSGERRRRIVAALADEAGFGSERCCPGGDVRGLAAGAGPRQSRSVRTRPQRFVEADDHVEQQVTDGAEDEPGHRRTIVPWKVRDVAPA